MHFNTAAIAAFAAVSAAMQVNTPITGAAGLDLSGPNVFTWAVNPETDPEVFALALTHYSSEPSECHILARDIPSAWGRVELPAGSLNEPVTGGNGYQIRQQRSNSECASNTPQYSHSEQFPVAPYSPIVPNLRQ
ncbi:hypothetical protein BJX63DRAFT_438277 [Aspergillus granulosus]|uniref:Uncharacterized protein n=1 Tax=Aspergillus granulosus TaxID=176169 RepID=A0ABR4GSE8_9EURO